MKSQQIVMVSFALFVMVMFSSVQGYRYSVQTVTGSGNHDDTDDEVYIKLINKQGVVSDKKRLDTPDDDFERKSTNNFQLDFSQDLGPIHKIELSKDGDDGWYCERVVVRDTRGSYTFIVNDMIDNIELMGIILKPDIVTVENQYAMESFVYHIDNMAKVGKKPKALGKIKVDNNCTSTPVHKCTDSQSLSLEISETTESSKHFTHTAGVAITVGTSITATVPGVSATASVSVTASYSFEWGKSESKSRQWTGSYPCKAPPSSTSYCEFYVNKMTIDVPFTIKWKNGKTTEGMYQGVDYLEGGMNIHTVFHTESR